MLSLQRSHQIKIKPAGQCFRSTKKVGTPNPQVKSVEAVPQPMDLEFIPAAQRDKAGIELQDELVTVGKGKRKRTRQQSNKEGAKRSKITFESDQAAENAEPFDHSGADNILDATPTKKEASVTRKTRKKGTFWLFIAFRH